LVPKLDNAWTCQKRMVLTYNEVGNYEVRDACIT